MDIEKDEDQPDSDHEFFNEKILEKIDEQCFDIACCMLSNDRTAMIGFGHVSTQNLTTIPSYQDTALGLDHIFLSKELTVHHQTRMALGHLFRSGFLKAHRKQLLRLLLTQIIAFM